MAKVIILSREDYISTREAANKYHYCLKTIRLLVKKRKVKGFKHAHKWYAHEPSLKTWINSL